LFYIQAFCLFTDHLLGSHTNKQTNKEEHEMKKPQMKDFGFVPADRMNLKAVGQ